MEENKIDIKEEIEKVLKIKGIVSNKFHMCVETDFETYCNWVLYLKFENFEKYMSNDNKPIMRSGIDSSDDLIKYLEKHGGLVKVWY